MTHDLTFWLGPVGGGRRVVSAPSAYQGFATCDSRINLDSEAYLGAFWYGPDFQTHVSRTGSTRDFDGACWSPWCWWDIDRAGDLVAAQQATARLAAWLLNTLAVPPDDLSIYFSGSKGFHCGCPMPSDAAPALDFHRRTRGMAEAVATAAGVLPIDPAIYTKCQPFRAPNSRHPKTGLYKVKLAPQQLAWTIERIQQAAQQPHPFKWKMPAPSNSNLLRREWEKTAAAPSTNPSTLSPEAGSQGDRTRLNALTLDFLRGGADQGDRHRLLFSASANLAEFQCPPELAEALLMPSALDSGLPSAEARRQIVQGLRHGRKGADE